MATSRSTSGLRPGADQTKATTWCDRFDRDDAPPLGIRRVATQCCHDLFGTKDVQDAITATYVWMADQIGHLTLGFVPTILLCWIASLTVPWLTAGSVWRHLVFIVPCAVVVGVWAWKELVDLKDTSGRTTGVFPSDSGDVIWNVKTALLYFGIGALLGLAAFLWWPLVPIVLVLSLWPALAVTFWWLRRKLAFQQAGLPYLYRLANFPGALDAALVETVSGIANLKNRRTNFLAVLVGNDPLPHTEPAIRHLLISGTLGSGKTSLCVGMGTEFAFALGKGRYLSATKLIELVVGGDANADERTYEDGLVLWNWRRCDLLIVDDVDAGVTTPAGRGAGRAARLIDPEAFVRGFTEDGKPAPLINFADRRTVWVLGAEPSALSDWQHAIAGLLGIRDGDLAIVQLSGHPGSTTEPATGRLVR
jgi:hypothetical protein